MIKYSFTFTLLLPCFIITAQSAVLTSGGNITSSSGSVAYSVGQLVTAPSSNGSVNISPGVQQPYEISELVNIESVLLPYNVKVFPVPTTDHIHIKTDEWLENEKLSGTIISAESKILLEFTIESSDQQLDVNFLPPGSYFLNISNRKNASRVFKIIKQ